MFHSKWGRTLFLSHVHLQTHGRIKRYRCSSDSWKCHTWLLLCSCGPNCSVSVKLILLSWGYLNVVILKTLFVSLAVVVLACVNEYAICWMSGDALIVIILESQSKDRLCKRLGTLVSWSVETLKQWAESESSLSRLGSKASLQGEGSELPSVELLHLMSVFGRINHAITLSVSSTFSV